MNEIAEIWDFFGILSNDDKMFFTWCFVEKN